MKSSFLLRSMLTPENNSTQIQELNRIQFPPWVPAALMSQWVSGSSDVSLATDQTLCQLWPQTSWRCLRPERRAAADARGCGTHLGERVADERLHDLRPLVPGQSLLQQRLLPGLRHPQLLGHVAQRLPQQPHQHLTTALVLKKQHLEERG